MPRAVAIANAALVALVACQPVSAPPSATQILISSPTVTATTGSPAPSATAGVLDERFGFVVTDRSGAKVRSETSDVVMTSFEPQGRSWTSLSRTVSPDGRSIAYWAPVNNGAVLRVRSVITGADSTVFTTRPEMFGNTFAWSSDGGGLVAAIDNGCQEICGIQGGTPLAELWTIDLASGATQKIGSGYFWLPITWDRANNRVAAGVTGPGGYLTGYHVIDLSRQPYLVRGVGFQPTVIGLLKASTDARYVSLTVDSGTTATLSWWPLAEPEKRADLAFDGAAAEWRPGTSEIWWVGGLTPSGCRTPPCSGTELKAVDVTSGARTPLHGSFGGALVGFRIDGSAAMTSLRGTPESLIVVDLKTGRTANLPVGGPFVRVR